MKNGLAKGWISQWIPRVVASCGLGVTLQLGHIETSFLPSSTLTCLAGKSPCFIVDASSNGCLSNAMLDFGGYELKSCEFSEGLLKIIIRKRWIQNDDRWMFSPDGLVVFQMSCESLSHTPILMTNVQSFYTFVCLFEVIFTFYHGKSPLTWKIVFFSNHLKQFWVYSVMLGTVSSWWDCCQIARWHTHRINVRYIIDLLLNTMKRKREGIVG